MKKITFAKGFTLVELLVVVAIVAILAAIAIPMYGKYVKKSRTSEAISNLGAISLYEETYFSENDKYTTCGASPTSVPKPSDQGGRLAFSTAVGGWSSLGRVIPDQAKVYFQYEVRAGQYDSGGNIVTSTTLVSPTSANTAGGTQCSGNASSLALSASGSTGSLSIPTTSSSNWFYATATGDQDGDNTCSLFVKIIDRPDIVIENEVE